MAKQYNADLFIKNGGLSTDVLMADGGVSPSSDFVNETSTFLPINTDGDFTDSPIFATKGVDKDGYNLLETKINDLTEFSIPLTKGFKTEFCSLELITASVAEVSPVEYSGTTPPIERIFSLLETS